MKLHTEKGEVIINSDVFTAITGAAATNCYGVKGMAVRSKTDGLVHLLKRESMAKGVKVSGATVHIVIPECDAGPIVLQKAVEVKQDDTPETLQKRIMEQAEWIILPLSAEKVCKEIIS